MPQEAQSTSVNVQYPSGHVVSFPDEETAQAHAPSVWDSLKREVTSAGSALNPVNLVKGVYQTASAPLTDEEQAEFKGHVRIPGEVAIERLTGAPIVRAAQWYRDAAQGKVPNAYTQALSVAPEAVGSAGGTVVGGKLLSQAPRAVGAVAKGIKSTPVATAATTVANTAKVTAAEQAAADFAEHTYGKGASGVLESTGESEDNTITGQRGKGGKISTPTEEEVNQFIKKQYGAKAPQVKIVQPSASSTTSEELNSTADAYNKELSTGVKLGKAKSVNGNVEHVIYKNQEPVGIVNARLGEDGTATINWIGDKDMTGSLNSKLGISGLKAIKAAFQDAHPQVKSLAGIRIGGAKGNLAKSVQVEVHGEPADAASNLANTVAPTATPATTADPKTSNLAAAVTKPNAPTTQRPADSLPSAVEDKLTELYTTAMPSFQLPDANEEHSFVYNKFGNPGAISTSRTAMKNAVTILPGITSGIVHTHPMRSVPHPSDEDVEIAKKAKVPNYILTRTQLWVATPDGKTRQVADVAVKDGKVSLNYLPTKEKK